MKKEEVVTPYPQRPAPKPEPDPLWLRLLNVIWRSPDGISRTGLREVAGHSVPAEKIERSLAWCERNSLAHCRKVKPPVFRGRWGIVRSGCPAEVWFAGG